MKVLVTGHDGYIGTVLVPLLRSAGHEVVGLDSGLFSRLRVRTRTRADGARSGRRHPRRRPRPTSTGFDAVIHLAAISQRSAGRPQPGLHLRHQPPRVDAPRRAGQGGRRPALPVLVVVQPLRGPGRRRPRRERPSSTRSRPYGESKVLVRARPPRRWPTTTSARPTCATPPPTASRRGCAATWWSTTSPASPYTTGEVFIKSDGTPWRPWSTSRTSPGRSSPCSRRRPSGGPRRGRSTSGATAENYRIREVAEIVEEVVPGAEVDLRRRRPGPTCATTGSTATRSPTRLPDFQPPLDGPHGRRGALRRLPGRPSSRWTTSRAAATCASARVQELHGRRTGSTPTCAGWRADESRPRRLPLLRQLVAPLLPRSRHDPPGRRPPSGRPAGHARAQLPARGGVLLRLHAGADPRGRLPEDELFADDYPYFSSFSDALLAHSRDATPRD